VPLLLSEADVRAVLDMRDLIDAMRAVLVEFSAGATQQPLRTVLQVGAEQAFFGVMPACVPARNTMGTKLVTVFESNAARGLPTHLATILLLDPSSGALLAIVDGRYITEARTAAVSAVATGLLARPDAGVLALIGSGVQARSHLEALAHVRTLREVRVWSPNPARRQSFVEVAAAHAPCRIVEAPSARSAVNGADLIAIVSAARQPVVKGEWIEHGAHLCAVGACRADQREMDTALVRGARLFVDSRTGALAEAGDILIPIAEGAITDAHIAGEIGEVAAGRIAGRRSPDEITIFKSLGMAVEDVAAAHLAFERARVRGLGRQI
jgi:ornithine cyclodeaminase/alanine dehydrogenase-like protein (mu-crystallin family)